MKSLRGSVSNMKAAVASLSAAVGDRALLAEWTARRRAARAFFPGAAGAPRGTNCPKVQLDNGETSGGGGRSAKGGRR